MKTTYDLIGKFRRAFAFFNEEIFGNRLPEVVITTQHHGNAYGFFLKDSYTKREFDAEGNLLRSEFCVSEISIMPDQMFDRPDREVLSTLVHEMVHLEQAEYGTPSRNGYHNREFSELMKEKGLFATSFGKYDIRNPALTEEEKKESPGKGKPTGQKVSHYIIPGGKFDRACEKLLETKFALDLHQMPRLQNERPKSKVKFTCETCGQNAWAKPGAKIACGFCHEKMKSEEEDENK